jgi:hypothetical protein
MKKLIFIILGVAIGHSLAFSQGCLPEGITFSTQAQVDSFQINYPGCTHIEGDVGIINDDYWGGFDITNLNGLSGVTSIGGSLSIRCFLLSNLAGLNALTSIGGDLSFGGYNWNGGISGNPSLTSLAGLEGLTSIGGNLSILGNSSLTSLVGLDNVSAASIANITIHNNSSLSNCNIQSICSYLGSPNGVVNIYSNASGCNSPAEIGNACGITMPCLPYGNYYFFSQADVDNFQTDYPDCSDLQGDVSITGNNIVNLSGFSQVTSISGNLNIGRYYGQTPVGNPLLASLTGLENLTQIGGTLFIKDNDTLTTLSGLDNLSTIGEDLLIGVTYVFSGRNYDALASISALGNLNSIGGELYISNTSLTSLSGLDNLSSIGSSITIYSNHLLADISGLANLTSITGGLNIAYSAITSLEGLNNVSTIAGNVYIDHNHSLKNFEGLENLSFIGTGAWIFDNDSLISMEGLNNLEYIDGYLDIWDNPSLSSLSGLENLDSIGSYLHISQNALTSLSALSGLQTIKGTLYIIYNDNITSLSGLDNLFTDSISELKLFYNSQLQTCDVRSICNYLAGPHGTAEIYGNAPGCNSQEEVEAACQVGVEDVSTNKELTIYPNPSPGQFTFEFSLLQQSMVNLVVLNSLGQVVATLTDGVLTSGTHQFNWNAENLPVGMYFLQLKTDNLVVTKKIIKQYALQQI